MAFKRWSKTRSKQGLNRAWAESEMKVIGWCLNNNIKISVIPDWKHDLINWQIDININGKNHNDPTRYEDGEALNKMYEYYKYYYDKHNK